MRLGIDASNIRGGGGLTHLRQMLAAADPPAHGFEQVVVWAPQSTLEQLKNQPWLLKRHDRALESHYLLRAWWQSTRLGYSPGMKDVTCCSCPAAHSPPSFGRW